MDAFTWLVVFIVMVGEHLALGRIISQENWWGDTRDGIEDRFYVDGNAVRQGLPSAELFWARARPWSPFGVGVAKDGSFDLQPTRDGQAMKPRHPWIRFWTAARTKFTDWVGCSHCSPFIPSFVFLWLAGVLTHQDCWTWQLLATNVCAWGAATELRD